MSDTDMHIEDEFPEDTQQFVFSPRTYLKDNAEELMLLENKNVSEEVEQIDDSLRPSLMH